MLDVSKFFNDVITSLINDSFSLLFFLIVLLQGLMFYSVMEMVTNKGM